MPNAVQSGAGGANQQGVTAADFESLKAWVQEHLAPLRVDFQAKWNDLRAKGEKLVEDAEAEAKDILEKAKAEAKAAADTIVADATASAEKIVAEAKAMAAGASKQK